MEEKRIYAIIAATIQVPQYPNTDRLGKRSVVQPVGRQIAQACHVTNELRLQMADGTTIKQAFNRIKTIILQVRDSNELAHVFGLLNRKHLRPVVFADDNPEYGPGTFPTAVAVFAAPRQVLGILDYLPLWGSEGTK